MKQISVIGVKSMYFDFLEISSFVIYICKFPLLNERKILEFALFYL